MEGQGRGPGRRPEPLPCGAVLRGPHRAEGPLQERPDATTVAAVPLTRQGKAQERGPRRGPDLWPRYGQERVYGISPNPLPTRLRNRPQQIQNRRWPAIRTSQFVKVIRRECNNRRTAATLPHHSCAAGPATRRSIVQQLTKQSRPTRLQRVSNLQPNSEFNLEGQASTDHQQVVRGDEMVNPDPPPRAS